MAQLVRVPATKPDNLRLVSGTHTVEGESRKLSLVFYTGAHVPPLHPNLKINKQM